MTLTVEAIVLGVTRPFNAGRIEPSPGFERTAIAERLAAAGFSPNQTVVAADVEKIIALISEQAGIETTSSQAHAYRDLQKTAASALLVGQISSGLELPSKLAGYTAQEVQLIQEVIEGKHLITREQVQAAIADLNTAFPQAKELLTLLPMYFQDRDCYQKAYWDPRVETLDVFTFFPQVLAVGIENINCTPQGRHRVAVKFEKDGEAFYIKQLQTESELKIALLAEKLELGPTQLPSLNGYITEAKVEGVPLHHLPAEMLTVDGFSKIGENLGRTLKQLHAAGIVYNDTIVLDDFGHSHLLIQPDYSVKLIDYGNALILADRDPASDEFLINYSRSRPFMALSADGDREEHLATVRHRLGQVKSEGVAHFINFDVELVRQGLYFARSRDMPGQLLGKLSEGFDKTFHS